VHAGRGDDPLHADDPDAVLAEELIGGGDDPLARSGVLAVSQVRFDECHGNSPRAGSGRITRSVALPAGARCPADSEPTRGTRCGGARGPDRPLTGRVLARRAPSNGGDEDGRASPRAAGQTDRGATDRSVLRVRHPAPRIEEDGPRLRSIRATRASARRRHRSLGRSAATAAFDTHGLHRGGRLQARQARGRLHDTAQVLARAVGPPWDETGADCGAPAGARSRPQGRTGHVPLGGAADRSPPAAASCSPDERRA